VTVARLVVRIKGRDEAEPLPLSAEHSAQEELTRFLNRHGPYAQAWIKLGDDEYVRYDDIESVRIIED
jgi:hypothetical protein